MRTIDEIRAENRAFEFIIKTCKFAIKFNEMVIEREDKEHEEWARKEGLL